MQIFHGFAHAGHRAALRAGLADFVVFARRLDAPPPFAHIVADRFFDVDVFAVLHRPDGGQRMPMIGRGDRHDVDRGIFECLAHVAGELGARPFASAAACLTAAWPLFSSGSTIHRISVWPIALKTGIWLCVPRPPAPTMASPSFSLGPVARDAVASAAQALPLAMLQLAAAGRQHRVLEKLSARLPGHARLLGWRVKPGGAGELQRNGFRGCAARSLRIM